MDDNLARALIAAARSFADELERGQALDSDSGSSVPRPGTSKSMLSVLESVARINDDQRRGVSDHEIREIARRAGMDPRGMAGYYAASLLEKRVDGTRWLSPGGRDRLSALSNALTLGAIESVPTQSTEPNGGRA
jgi:hypothetical protein